MKTLANIRYALAAGILAVTLGAWTIQPASASAFTGKHMVSMASPSLGDGQETHGGPHRGPLLGDGQETHGGPH